MAMCNLFVFWMGKKKGGFSTKPRTGKSNLIALAIAIQFVIALGYLVNFLNFEFYLYKK